MITDNSHPSQVTVCYVIEQINYYYYYYYDNNYVIYDSIHFIKFTN